MGAIKVKTNELVGHAEGMQGSASNLSDLQWEVQCVRTALTTYTTLPQYIYSNIDRLCSSLEQQANRTKRAAATLVDVAYDYEKTEAGLIGEEPSFDPNALSTGGGGDLELYPPDTRAVRTEFIHFTALSVIVSPTVTITTKVSWTIMRKVYYDNTKNNASKNQPAVNYFYRLYNAFRQYVNALTTLIARMHHVVSPVRKTTCTAGSYSVRWNMPTMLSSYNNPSNKIKGW